MEIDNQLKKKEIYGTRVVVYKSGMIVVNYDDGSLDKFFKLSDLLIGGRKNGNNKR